MTKLNRKEVIRRFRMVLMGVYSEALPKNKSDIDSLSLRLYSILVNDDELTDYRDMIIKDKRDKKQDKTNKKMLKTRVKNKIIGMYNDGFTFREIVAKANTTHYRVHKTLKEYKKENNIIE